MKKLDKGICVLTLICAALSLLSTSCIFFKISYFRGLEEYDPPTGWKVDICKIIIYPTDVDHGFPEYSTLYDICLYERKDSSWISKMVIEQNLTTESGHIPPEPYYPSIFWEDDRYIYISASIGYIYLDNDKSFHHLKLYKIDPEKRVVLKSADIEMLDGRSDIYDIDFKLLQDDKLKYIVIFNQYRVAYGGFKLILTTDDMSGEMKCFTLLDQVQVSLPEDYSVYYSASMTEGIIRLKYTDQSETEIMKEIAVKQLSEEKCVINQTMD